MVRAVVSRENATPSFVGRFGFARRIGVPRLEPRLVGRLSAMGTLAAVAAVAAGAAPRQGFNAFCAKGVAAKKRARAERERREGLMRVGVVDVRGVSTVQFRMKMEL